ncbi:LysE family translocator [Derxia gummosa]|uniref:LysE family translocator n=1 Tax=Derxia gummosa DSM 723 TaxID=1121388 RepID=A0A8B6X697_9BURK|nr:LysE family translocator [Derxia gummosa]
MPSLQTTLAFLGVALVLGFTPGPDNLFVLMQSIARGRRAGLLVVAGLCCGLCAHTAAVACGLAAVFAASATAFTVLKFAGAAYLGWLAWQALRAPAGDLDDAAPPALAARALVLRGFTMNLTNPKVLLFFLAFLPQFVEPAAGPVAAQVAWFGLCFIAATLLSFGCIALLAGAIGGWLRRSARARVALNRLCGVVFAGLALRLLAASR